MLYFSGDDKPNHSTQTEVPSRSEPNSEEHSESTTLESTSFKQMPLNMGQYQQLKNGRSTHACKHMNYRSFPKLADFSVRETYCVIYCAIKPMKCGWF